MLAKKCLLVGIFILFSVSLAIADPPAVHPVTGEGLVIDCLRGTPDAIDGDLSDWNLEAMTPAILDVVEQLHSGQDTWDAPEDCSGEFYMLWDDVNIYMAVVVKDDTLSTNKTDGNIWNADAVEVFFSTLNAVADHSEHYQYGFTASNQRWNWCNIDGAGSIEPEYLQIAATGTADGYICEVSIEYAQMPSLDFSAGNTIGFHPVFDDTDNVDRELQMTWTGREAHDQSLGFGHMILLADPVPAQRTLLFAESFEGLPLGPNVDEALAGDAVWTDTPPEGWAVDESGIPGIGLDATDGVTEWAGWAFTDKAWWTEAAEDQDRSLFELGSGIVAVADPDEWDDGERLPIPIEADPYDTWLTTSAIDIAGAEAGTLQLKFDSSWRPEFDDNYHQTASITASFDGGEPVVVMLWESDGASTDYKPYATNETVVVDLDSPEGARSLVLTFGLFDAGNDWWWAIDNIEVLAVVPEPVPVAPGNDGLVAYYALHGDPNDSSGNGNDGTIGNLNGGLGLDGSVWVDDPERGTVISFNGTAEGAYVRAGEIPQMTLTNDFTWAFWAKHSDENTADNDIILGNRMDENAVDFVPRQFIKFTPTKFEWHMNGNGDDNLDYDDIPADVWLHHSVVKAADRLTYYRNGIKASSGTFTQPLDFPQPLYFGGDNEGAEGENWAGLMSDVSIYDRALSAGEVMFLADLRAVPVDPGTDGLAAFHTLDGDTNDSSGNELNGAIVGDPNFVEGQVGMALELDGVDDYVDLGNPSMLDFGTGDFTISAWINMTATERGTVYAKGGDNSGGIRYTLAMGEGNDNRMTLTTDDDSSKRQARGGTVVNDGTWHHVVGMRRGDTSLVFVDGDKDGAIDLPGDYDLSGASQANALIGAITDAQDATGASLEKFFAGLIDEVAVYDRALSGGEVRYLAGHRAPVEVPGLVGHWTLDEGSGTTVADVSGNGNDGTIMDNPDLENPTWIDGISGSALEFHGTGVAGTGGDFIDCGNDASLDITGPISIALWIRPDADDPEGKGTSGGETAPMAKATSDWSYQVRYGWGGAPTPYMSFTFNTSPRAWASVGRNLERYEWCHIACSYDGTTLKCYLDGVETDSTPMGEIHSSADPVLIGSDGWKSDWTGAIDDVRIYDRGLSADEIVDIAAGL